MDSGAGDRRVPNGQLPLPHPFSDQRPEGLALRGGVRGECVDVAGGELD